MENKQVLQTCANAINKAMRELYGPPSEAPENMAAQIAVALLQLSMQYFVTTGAPKQVVLEFVLDILGMTEKAKVVEKTKGSGNLIIVPPTSPFVGFGGKKDG